MKNTLILILYALFIFLLPTQLAKHFWPDFAIVHSIRIDYLAPKLYLTDILAILIIFLNANNIWHHVKKYRYILIAIIPFFIAHIVFSLSPLITILKLLKILEIVGIGISIYHLFFHASPDGRSQLKTIFFTAFLGGALFQLYLVLLQLFFHSSVGGIFYYFGERAIKITSGNIATASWQGVEFLRPYGTFSHPNSLGGFYLLIYFFVFYDTHLKKQIFLKNALLLVSSFLILCSFSKAAIGTYILLNIISLILMIRNIPCIFCVGAKIMVFFTIGIVFMMAQGDMETISKRVWLAFCAVDIIRHHPVLGTGLGTYLLAQRNFPVPYPYHFLQPVHNIILLTLAEIGIPALLGALYGLFLMIKKYGLHYQFLFCVLALFITGMVDHYWLTLQQNLLLMGVAFGYTARGNVDRKI